MFWPRSHQCASAQDSTKTVSRATGNTSADNRWDVQRTQCRERAYSGSSNQHLIDGEVLRPKQLRVDCAEDEAKAVKNPWLRPNQSRGCEQSGSLNDMGRRRAE